MQEDIQNMDQVLLFERMEDDDLINPIQELRTKRSFELAHHLFFSAQELSALFVILEPERYTLLN